MHPRCRPPGTAPRCGGAAVVAGGGPQAAAGPPAAGRRVPRGRDGAGTGRPASSSSLTAAGTPGPSPLPRFAARERRMDGVMDSGLAPKRRSVAGLMLARSDPRRRRPRWRPGKSAGRGLSCVAGAPSTGRGTCLPDPRRLPPGTAAARTAARPGAAAPSAPKPVNGCVRPTPTRAEASRRGDPGAG